MNAKIDTMAPIAHLGSNLNDVRYLAHLTLTALGVNLGADDGHPTIETIYSHGLTEFAADLRKLGEPLLEGNDTTLNDIGASIMRLHDRIELLNEAAGVLASIVAAEKGGAP